MSAESDPIMATTIQFSIDHHRKMLNDLPIDEWEEALRLSILIEGLRSVLLIDHGIAS